MEGSGPVWVTFTGETVFDLADMFCCCHHLGASSEEEGGGVGLVQQGVQGIEDGDGKLSSFELNWKKRFELKVDFLVYR